MKTELPEIRFPEEPLPDAWRDVLSALVERATVVEQWALELRERSLYALRRYETTTMMLDQLLDDPARHQEAHRAIRAAAQGIKAQRAKQGQTAH
jgi:hypothetical protein